MVGRWRAKDGEGMREDLWEMRARGEGKREKERDRMRGKRYEDTSKEC